MGKRRRVISLNRGVVRKGEGLLNTLINKLPLELHIPGYNYCGPGTRLRKRLERGDVGINSLDEACKEHDIAYSESEDLLRRHEADEKLYKKAVGRIKSKDSGIGERLASTVVATLMKGKTKMGMGVRKIGGRRKYKRLNRKRKYRHGGALSFLQAMKRARSALGRGAKTRSVLDNSRIAYRSLKRWRGKKISAPRSRIIQIPKSGGFLPLIPLFAALGALGSIGGGAAAIAKTVNEAKTAKEQLLEAQRHNRVMETKKGGGLHVKPYKSGCGIQIGKGLYVKPYKSGCGIYLPNSNETKNV